MNLILFQIFFPHTARLETTPLKNVVGYESGVSKELVSQVKVTTEVFNPHTSSPLFFTTVMEQYSTIVMDTVVNGALCGQGGKGAQVHFVLVVEP